MSLKVFVKEKLARRGLCAYIEEEKRCPRPESRRSRAGTRARARTQSQIVWGGPIPVIEKPEGELSTRG